MYRSLCCIRHTVLKITCILFIRVFWHKIDPKVKELEERPLKILLFVWDLSSHSKFFHSYGNVTIAGEGLQILTYARYLWSLSSEGSLAVELSLPGFTT